MTEIEARATGGYRSEADGGSVWGAILVPMLAALLVVALGLVLVSLTDDRSRTVDPDPPTAGSGVY